MEYDYIEVVDDSDIGDNISLTLEITFAKTKTSCNPMFQGWRTDGDSMGRRWPGKADFWGKHILFSQVIWSLSL